MTAQIRQTRVETESKGRGAKRIWTAWAWTTVDDVKPQPKNTSACARNASKELAVWQAVGEAEGKAKEVRLEFEWRRRHSWLRNYARAAALKAFVEFNTFVRVELRYEAKEIEIVVRLHGYIRPWWTETRLRVNVDPHLPRTAAKHQIDAILVDAALRERRQCRLDHLQALWRIVINPAREKGLTGIRLCHFYDALIERGAEERWDDLGFDKWYAYAHDLKNYRRD